MENVGPDVGQHLASLLDSLHEALVYLDRQVQVMYLNQQAERLLQQPRAALLGQALWEACPAAVGSTFYRQSHPAGEISIHFEEFSPPLNR